MNSLNEEWRDCVGYEGLYQVSSFGRVRSCDRYIDHYLGGKSFIKGAILKSNFDDGGYLKLSIYANGKKLTRTVHQLVAETFLGDRVKGRVVNHIDGCKANNSVANLEYCSHKDNIRHSYTMGLCASREGEKNHQAKLTASDVREIRSLLASGEIHADIAKRFGVSRGAITKIKLGETWTHIA